MYLGAWRKLINRLKLEFYRNLRRKNTHATILDI